MARTEVVEALVTAGKASGGPPLGPALGPTGVNVTQVVDAINKETKGFAGLKVPVKVEVNLDDKSFKIEVGTPPTSALILSELSSGGDVKGSGNAGTEIAGDISFGQVVIIAKSKNKDMLAINLKGAVKEVLGTCVSIGVTVEGKDPREVQKTIDEGMFDEMLT